MKKSYTVENGLTLGVALLALLVLFGIGLPRWQHHQSTASLTLPEKLSGGYAQTTDSSELAAIATQTTAASQTLGVAAAAGEYSTSAGTAPLFVQAVRGAGTALLPAISGTYSKVGDSACYAQTTASASGQTAQLVVCRKTNDHLTVQVTSYEAATAAKYATEIWNDLLH